MPRLSFIQLKALFLLVTFTASFTVFCHCECVTAMNTAMAGKVQHHSCCEKTPEKANHQQEQHDCQGMQAVRFHLLEKQAADPVHASAAPLTAQLEWGWQPVNTMLTQTEKRKLPQQWSYKHSPPNLLSLYQCFLI
jgi:hypothetical protein